MPAEWSPQEAVWLSWPCNRDSAPETHEVLQAKFGWNAWAALPAAIALGAAAAFGPPALIEHLTVFVLACVLGWHLVWNVTPALHTPLMSVTNAISGIILIGGMLALFGGGSGALALGGVAILVAAINVAGGFLVTQRMLRMFRRG